MLTIYAKLRRLAAPVLKHYTTDLTVHDRKACRALKPGDMGFWCVRESGTHLCVVSPAPDATPEQYRAQLDYARSYAVAIRDVNPDAQWHVFECPITSQHGHVWQSSPGEVLKWIDALLMSIDRHQRIAA